MKTTPDTRPLAERITQGPYKRIRYTGDADSHKVCTPLHNICGGSNKLCGADAELIAEAFNVTHETGRTPRQLADERAELIAALRDLVPGEYEFNTSPHSLARARQLLTSLNP